MLHLNYGGLEKQTITLINELAKTEKYQITIVSVYDLLEGKSFYDIDKRVKVEFLSNFGPHHKEFFYALKHFKVFKFLKEAYIMIKCGIYKSIVLKNYIKKLDCFPNACIAYRILLTIPVTIASGERSFSKLKLIKSYLRSTMSQERLNGLTILLIESDILTNLKYKSLISNFCISKS